MVDLYYLCIFDRLFVPEDSFKINMSIKKFVNRSIPFAVEFFKTASIPPVLVKHPISEASNLCEEVQVIFEYHMEDHKPHDCTR